MERRQEKESEEEEMEEEEEEEEEGEEEEGDKLIEFETFTRFKNKVHTD